MADTADLRSEGDRSQNRGAVAERKRKHKLNAAGLCQICGKVEVQGRKTCYGCSADQAAYTYLSGLRYHFRQAGIDPKEMLQFLDTLPFKDWDELEKLKDLMKAGLYKTKRTVF